MFVMLGNHKKPDGSVDWEAWDRALTANGEKCVRCRRHLFHVAEKDLGKARICEECKDLDENLDRVTHRRLVRCPKCGCQKEINTSTLNHDNSTASVECPSCGHAYTITVVIEYYFTSPARL